MRRQRPCKRRRQRCIACAGFGRPGCQLPRQQAGKAVFLFFLAGGPLLEWTHGKRQFTAPLTAVAAAVLGVRASLALFFIANIACWTVAAGQFVSQIEIVAPALLRYEPGVMTVIAGRALAGSVLRWAGWAGWV